VVHFGGVPACARATQVGGGLPQGVQVVGAMHDDDRVLEVCALLEAELGSILGQMPEAYRVG